MRVFEVDFVLEALGQLRSTSRDGCMLWKTTIGRRRRVKGLFGFRGFGFGGSGLLGFI